MITESYLDRGMNLLFCRSQQVHFSILFLPKDPKTTREADGVCCDEPVKRQTLNYSTRSVNPYFSLSDNHDGMAVIDRHSKILLVKSGFRAPL